MASDTIGAAEKENRSPLLIFRQHVLLAASESIKRSVGEDQGEFEFGDRPGEHVVRHGGARLHLREDLAEEFAVLRDVVDPPDDLGADVEVVAGKDEARRLDPFGRRDKGLRDQQVCLIGKSQPFWQREHEAEAVIERIKRQRCETRVPHQAREERGVRSHRRASLISRSAPIRPNDEIIFDADGDRLRVTKSCGRGVAARAGVVVIEAHDCVVK